MHAHHMAPRSMSLRRALVACMLAVCAALVATAAHGHARVTRADPADGAVMADAPRALRMWFDEPISARFSTAQLLDGRGRKVEGVSVQAAAEEPRSMLLALPELAPGVYSVLVRTLSEADGHLYRSFLVFGVGEGTELAVAVPPPPEPPSFIEILLRWTHFTLLCALIGGAVVAQRVLPACGFRCDGLERVAQIRRAAQCRILHWAAACGVMALLIGLALLAWQIRQVQGAGPAGEGAALDVLIHTRWGWLWLVRESLLAMVTWTLLALHARARRADGLGAAGVPHPCARPHTAWQWAWQGPLLASGCVGLAIVQALGGHASAVSPHTPLALGSDALHVLGACVWVGGMLALAVGLLPAIRGSDGHGVAFGRAACGAFSPYAAASVAVLIATGVYNLGNQVASADALITTSYGLTVLAKIALVLAVGACGLVNTTLLHPARIARLLRLPEGWTPFTPVRLTVSLRCESGLALAVLLATGAITAMQPPRGVEFNVVREQITSAMTRTVDDMVITLLVKPNRPGQNVFTVFAASTQRPAPAQIMRVLVRFTYLEEDLGRVTNVAEPVEPGRWLVGASHLSLPGRWRIEVAVRRKGVEDAVASYPWVLPPPGEIPPTLVSRAPLDAVLAEGVRWLLPLLSVPAAVFVWRRRPRATALNATEDVA